MAFSAPIKVPPAIKNSLFISDLLNGNPILLISLLVSFKLINFFTYNGSWTLCTYSKGTISGVKKSSSLIVPSNKSCCGNKSYFSIGKR